VRTVLVSAAVSLLLALFGTPLAIRLFTKRGYGQLIREEGPAAHATKRGTPTMGGTVIVVATVIGYFVGHAATAFSVSASGVLVLGLMAALGLVGFVDDFLKIYKQTSLGLRSGAKLAGQSVVAAVFAFEVLRYPNFYDITPASAYVSFLRDVGPVIGVLPFVVWIMLLVGGWSNAVNLTDGLDGLATGSAISVLTAYVLIANWQVRNACTGVSVTAQCYAVRDPLDLAVVASAALGACIGFLWWNAPPARIFMGDTGSLALGGVLAGLAVCTQTQLLLVILGGLFVIITLSVIIQVGFYKMTGRRVFRMAPLQHHFELLGWAETTIVVRFWLISGLFVALGLGVFYLEWLPG
jgi:phospho-N-acetylmuramoyl-pentapeptide-transferase